MKTIGLIGLMGLIVFGCDRQERAVIRQGAVTEIAENMGKAEVERFLRGGLEIEERKIAGLRKLLDGAELEREATLQRDLIAAEAEARRIRREIAELK